MGEGEARYLLKVQLDDRIEGLGVRADDTVTRERRTLRARYQLVDTADGATVLDETTGWDAGIDVASSEYATVAAEESALERLTEIVADRVLARVAIGARQ
jgi:LPS-assembly lipoprotein